MIRIEVLLSLCVILVFTCGLCRFFIIKLQTIEKYIHAMLIGQDDSYSFRNAYCIYVK